MGVRSAARYFVTRGLRDQITQCSAGGLFFAGLGGENRYAISSLQDSLRFEGVHYTILLERPADPIILVQISGTDTGEFGEAPMRALHEWLASCGPVKLFIDARAVRGVSIDVSSEWAAWLSEHRSQLQSMTS